MAARRTGRKWRIVGLVWKAGKQVRRTTKVVIADSEAKIEVAERAVRDELSQKISQSYKGRELKDVRIEVHADMY